MNILHATTDPDLLTRLKEMLDSSARADIAVGYFFMSGFEFWPTGPRKGGPERPLGATRR